MHWPSSCDVAFNGWVSSDLLPEDSAVWKTLAKHWVKIVGSQKGYKVA